MPKIRMSDAYEPTPTLRSSNNPWRDFDNKFRRCGDRKREAQAPSHGVNTFQPRVKKISRKAARRIVAGTRSESQVWGYIS